MNFGKGAGITNAASVGNPRLDGVTSYPARDAASNTSTLIIVQAAYVARRFGLPADRARLIASIAFGDAQ